MVVYMVLDPDPVGYSTVSKPTRITLVVTKELNLQHAAAGTFATRLAVVGIYVVHTPQKEKNDTQIDG